MALAISAFDGADSEKKVTNDKNFQRIFYPYGDANLSRTLQPLVLGSTDDGERFNLGRACVSGTTFQTDLVADSETIPHLVQMLQSSTVNVCESLLPSLAHIVGENSEQRDYAIGLGIIPPLLSFVKSDSDVQILRHVSWVFCNLCCHKNPQLPLQTVNQIFPALRLLSDSLDKEVLVNTILALSYLTGSGSEYIQMVIDSGFVPVLVSLLPHDDESVQTATLRAVGNIVSRTDEHTQVVLNHNMLAHFPALLDHKKENIRREALWVISNVSAGAQSQIQAVVNAGLLPKLIENMWTGELQTQKEAAWAVRNLTITGNNKNLAKLIKVNAIKPLCSLLVCHDEEVLEIALESIQNMLRHIRYAEQVADYIKVCHGLPLIEYHQKSENSRISSLAHAIIDQLVSKDDIVAPKFCCFRRSSGSRTINC